MVKTKIDSKGQMEIDNIDTPLGKAAEEFVLADAKFKGAKSTRDDAMTKLCKEMQAANTRTLKFKGDTLRYKPGHVTPEKIQFVRSEG